MTALVLGVLALAFCWGPASWVRFTAAGVGVVALLVAIVAFARASRTPGARSGLAGAAMGVAAVAVVGALVAQALVMTVLDDGDSETASDSSSDTSSDSSEDPTDEPSEAESPSDEPSASELTVPPAPTPPSPGSPDSDSGGGSAGPTLALGEKTTIGDYEVTVAAYDADANAEIKKANQFNAAPSKGRYVLASLEVTYRGSKPGTAWLDLHPTLTGADAAEYDWTSCSAVTPHPGFETPDLRKGDSASFDVCFDVPPAAAAGTSVTVAESLNFTDPASASWATE